MLKSSHEHPLSLNDPNRIHDLRALIKKKSALHALYLETYRKYQDCINRSPRGGTILEIGSGAGFAKEIIPNLITSDILGYAGVDKVLDATQLDFPDESLACICLFNVLHHIADTPQFFREVQRCLTIGGRLLMIEPYPGWISTPIYRHLHHENFDLEVQQWEFESQGPVSDANNALPYIIFERDQQKFCVQFPRLQIEKLSPHTPLRYWLSGGLKKWSVLSQATFPFATWLDKTLIKLSPKLGSFMDIELVKQ